ncbi:MAG: hypothetical protein ACOC8L_10125 [Spirochaetota bacterium]
MSERLVNVDRTTPMLLPVDLRGWVTEDDMVHFVLEAIESMPGTDFAVNRRGSGSPQYPPQMMAALLVYCYSQGSVQQICTMASAVGFVNSRTATEGVADP